MLLGFRALVSLPEKWDKSHWLRRLLRRSEDVAWKGRVLVPWRLCRLSSLAGGGDLVILVAPTFARVCGTEWVFGDCLLNKWINV